MELDAQFEPNGGGGGGTSNYNQLSNKPSINNVTLSGNKSASDLGLGTYSKPSGGIPASDLESAVQTSLGKADTALQSYTETDPIASAMVADEYSSSATYAIGDYCKHSGSLYRCTTTISTAEAWTAAHWTAVTVGEELTAYKEDITNIQNATLITDTASGAIASFPDGAAMPVKDLTVSIEPVQSGSGDPSPTNIRPISGWTQAKVTRTGANVIDMSGIDIGKNWTGATVTNRAFGIFPCTAGKTYNVEVFGMSATDVIIVLDMNNIGSQNHNYTLNATAPSTSYTSIGGYVGVQYQKSDDGAITQSDVDKLYVVVTTGDIDTYTIDLDGTRYGGTLDVTTGVLTVDKVIVGTDDLSWTHSSSTPTRWTTAVTQSSAGSGSYILCSHLKTASGFPSASSTSIYMNSTSQIVVNIASATSESNFSDFVSGGQIVYELATPTTVQLTAQEITTLLGQNNIFADCGDTTVEYRANTKLYIQKVMS